MSGSSADIRRELLLLEMQRLTILSRRSFVHFLIYASENYQMLWYHKLVAEKCEALLRGDIKRLMVFLPPQHGKEIADSQLVPTPKGFKRHGDLQVGDYVFDRNGQPTKVLAISEKTQSQYRVFFSDGAIIDCHGNHEWQVYSSTERRERIFETKHLARLKLETGISNKRGHKYLYRVDVGKVVQFAKRETILEPYILGAWLGDGSAGGGLIHIGNNDIEIIKDSELDFQECKGSTTRRFSSSQLSKKLKQLGIRENKDIPEEYIFNTEQVRRELVAGLIDTDGYVYGRNGRITFSNTNKNIINKLALILRSLGENVTITEFEPALTTSGIQGRKICYQLCFNPSNYYPTKVPRKKICRIIKERSRSIIKIEKLENGELGNCIQVDGGIYLVGETFVPTHNSEIISRMFPAFAFGANPDLKIVGCSYSADLAQQFCRSIQRIIDSDLYRSIFPESFINGTNAKSQQSKGYLRNVDLFEMVGKKGFYKAVGVGGSLTGTPVDIAIIDDPVKDASEAYSTTYRMRVWDWYNTVLSTRLHNESRQLFIMTRWHEDDLAGRILKAEPDEWTVVKIPAICEDENDNGLSNRRIGEALWEDRHSIEKLLKQQARSPREFSALYQQHPTIEGGNIVKRDWLPIVTEEEFQKVYKGEPIHFYLDTAYNKKKKNADNDPSGILAAILVAGTIYILHAKKMYLEMPDLLKFLPKYMHEWGADRRSTLKVEPKANGISVVQMLRATTDLNVRETPTPTDDKEVRLRAVTPRIECGRVALIAGSWNEEFLSELCNFPTAPHDEFVDILGYAINDLYQDDDDGDWENLTKANFGLI